MKAITTTDTKDREEMRFPFSFVWLRVLGGSPQFKIDGCSLHLLMTDLMEVRRGEFLISTDPARLDLDVIHGFLTNCYWAKGIPREVVQRSIEHSLCFGIYHEGAGKSPLLAKSARDGAPCAPQVGFARVISDLATIAYLGDVFVLESYRGQGLGKWMMECIMRHPSLQGLRRWILLTRDAHGLYSQFGFSPLKSRESYMERHQANLYEIREPS